MLKWQVAALRAIDRERLVFDELVNFVNGPHTLPAEATPLYSQLVSKNMSLLGWRCLHPPPPPTSTDSCV